MKYEVKGGNLPVLLVYLEAGETIECEAGAMSWMDEGIEMQTQGGGIGKMFGRILTNENAFVNHYTEGCRGRLHLRENSPARSEPSGSHLRSRFTSRRAHICVAWAGSIPKFTFRGRSGEVCSAAKDS